MKTMCSSRPALGDARVEALEPRLALSLGASAQEIYYPDGYAHGAITEVVSMSNPDMFAVQYELWARYETGERDQLIRAGTIAPGGWEDVSISDPASPESMAVRPDTPFSFVLRSTGRLDATLRHDDFGSSAGEAFVAVAGTAWAIPKVSRAAGDRDFIVLYNPTPSAVQVQVEFWDDSSLAWSMTATVEAFRRGGWNVNLLTSLPRGDYGVRILSSGNIVVGHSHYDLVRLVSSINIAALDRGSLAGALLSAEFDDRDRPGCGPSEDTLVAVFNPGEAEATVTFNYIVRDGTGHNPDPTELTIPARGRRWMSLKQLGFVDHDVSIIWESDNPVVVAAFSRRSSAFIVTRSEFVAATEWRFASAFVDRVHASVMNTEDVLAFNPTSDPVDVTLTFTFRNGSRATETRSLGAYQVLDIDTDWPVQGIGAGHPFTVHVESTGPIVAALEHWNRRRIPGHYPAHGTPGGTVVLLSEVLQIPSTGRLPGVRG